MDLESETKRDTSDRKRRKVDVSESGKNVSDAEHDVSDTEQNVPTVDDDPKAMINYISNKYPNGQMAVIGSYLNGQKHGHWRRWHLNGCPKSIENFVNGKKHGYCYYYIHDDYCCSRDEYYHHGEPAKVWTIYDEEGHVAQRIDHNQFE